ncbi:oligoribonuclease isoform X2 [Triticum urartu]|uniref:oligoribonuclease isoform X2 n=1 Tax=Triticum urartu TaxID=4572 RepID=UPI0020436A68|nr:oligoribonuclease isoform X2 [Triticum urartu]
MANLANMFAVLDLDGEDDRKEVEQPTSSKPEAAAAAAPRKPDSGMMNNKMIVNYDGDKLGSLSSEYKMPLVWIDLEMTGLDIRKDRILEIACIITDGKLTKRIEGPDLVIRQSKECLDNMNEWCKTHHGASGLTEQVLQSDISECDAEKQVLDFVRRYIGSATPLIAGNSIYTDLLFLKEYMPQLAGIFPHVIVDVSSITALCIRWFPKGKLFFSISQCSVAEFDCGVFSSVTRLYKYGIASGLNQIYFFRKKASSKKGEKPQGTGRHQREHHGAAVLQGEHLQIAAI